MLLAGALALLIGLSLGLLGGGGSILTVPLLVYAVGVEPSAAIATSLLVVGVTSAVAAVQHARAGNVRWRVAALFGGAGMVGAYAGGRVAAAVPPRLLLLGFASMMLAAAGAMWRRPRAAADCVDAPHRRAAKVLSPRAAAVEGILVGFATGMVGAGGGFLVVPALALLGGLPMRAAIGSSLVVIAVQSLAGFAGHARHVVVDLPLAGTVTVAAVLGSVAGVRFAARVDARTLRRGFAVFAGTMALYVTAREIPVDWPELVRAGGVPVRLAVAAAVTLALALVARAAARHSA